MISEPSRRISACSSPTALLAASSERNEFGADEFGKAVGAVGLGHPVRAHLVQHDADAGSGDLPGGFRAGEAGADDMHGFGGDVVPVMGTEVARLREWNAAARYDNARARRALSVQQSAESGSAVIGAGCDARNVRAIKADIGQFAIAELGQFADIALIVPERLDHADEREQHGSLLAIYDSALGGSLIVEMNIGQYIAVRKLTMLRCS